MTSGLPNELPPDLSIPPKVSASRAWLTPPKQGPFMALDDWLISRLDPVKAAHPDQAFGVEQVKVRIRRAVAEGAVLLNLNGIPRDVAPLVSSAMNELINGAEPGVAQPEHSLHGLCWRMPRLKLPARMTDHEPGPVHAYVADLDRLWDLANRIEGTGPVFEELMQIWQQQMSPAVVQRLLAFLAEPPEALMSMGLTRKREDIEILMSRMVCSPNLSSPDAIRQSAEVAGQLLHDGLTDMPFGALARVLGDVRSNLSNPGLKPPNPPCVLAVLGLAEAITAHASFRAQGWLSERPDAVALRYAVTDLMRALPLIVGRCPSVTPAERDLLIRRAAQIRI